jgi:DNA-binding MurR/RpiR family transcriptional regulator
MAISLTLFYGSPNAHNGAAASLGSIARASQKLNAIAFSQFRVSLTAVLFLTSLAPCGADPAHGTASQADLARRFNVSQSTISRLTL